MTLLRQFISRSGSTDHSLLDMGENQPPWYPTPTTSNVYTGSSAYEPNFFSNLVNDTDVYIQYGQNAYGWASIKLFKYKIEVLEETLQDDNSYKVRVRITPQLFQSVKCDFSQAGWAVDYHITINNEVVWSFSANTYADFKKGNQPPIEFDTVIPPREFARSTTLKMDIVYPNGEAESRSLYIGLTLFNTNNEKPKDYVPFAIRKNGTVKSLNKNDGFIKIRLGGVWIDKSREDEDTKLEIGEGHNRIRKNGTWKQLPPME